MSEAVEKELEGLGNLLGYRAMHHKLRTQDGIKVPRHLVHNMMADLDPDGLDARNLQKRLKRKKKPFESDCPHSLVSLDGHDKLCGYQNWAFPPAVYGCLDTFSRKILFLFLSYSNSDPLIIGNRYLAYLTETQILPKILRVDKGTETGKMASIHLFLQDKIGDLEDPMDSIIFGPSTTYAFKLAKLAGVFTEIRYMNARLITLGRSKNAMENLKCKMKTIIEIIKQYVY